MSILSRAGLILAATVFAAACAPADATTATGPSASASAAAQACPSGGLPTLTAGTLTIGTDQPVYQPWYVDDAPENGQGFESAVAYAIAEQLGYPKDKVSPIGSPDNMTFDNEGNIWLASDGRQPTGGNNGLFASFLVALLGACVVIGAWKAVSRTV